ncbi:MAG: M1 family metallopeptidase [Bacteroidota bacterium]
MTRIFTRLGAFTFSALLLSVSAFGQANSGEPKFRQLGTELPTPNTWRSASGAPGRSYWKQKADYDIKVTLDDDKRSLTGSETITYFNNSPDELKYLWLQLDQNLFKPESDTKLTQTSDIGESMNIGAINNYLRNPFEGGYDIKSVKTHDGKSLHYVINRTMMRIDLPTPLASGASFSFSIDWFNYINEVAKNGGRGGYEYFPDDKNNLYEIAQWHPRMAVYDDANGWQHKQYLGSGEFALDFGNFKVAINVPANFIVGATGELQNADKVLEPAWKTRWNSATTSPTAKPVVIVTHDEAVAHEKQKTTARKTWVYSANNVRDFAWAASAKFIWDAKPVEIGGKKIWAMSLYPKEGNPLWGQFSTEVVAHTLRTYSKYSINYPYPVAYSVHGPVYGMEYPMICFNGGRPEKDGTYSERAKGTVIGVVTHEVGHNFFPMIISSDERQWTWMDEGLNTFLQYLTEQEWQRNYPSSRGEPARIANYMKSDKNAQVPIMVNSESILQFGNNAYGKPATALNILRETVLGRELFDFAFKTYCERWAWKHPNPADFFRTMEDASGTDLDWFWRGWFYTTDHVDIGIKDADMFRMNTQNPERENAITRKERDRNLNTVSTMNNAKSIAKTRTEENPDLVDFYHKYDPLAVTDAEKQNYEKFLADLSPEDKALLNADFQFYRLTFENVGGLVMPIILKAEFEDGTDSTIRIPAEIWRYNAKEVTKAFAFRKAVSGFTLDPYQETADADADNNSFPRRLSPSRFKVFKDKAANTPPSNPMKQEKERNAPKPAGGPKN